VPDRGGGATAGPRDRSGSVSAPDVPRPDGAPTLVFFGMDGPFAQVPLGALSAAGLVPSLVVVGVDVPEGMRGPVLEWRPVGRSLPLWSRLAGGAPRPVDPELDLVTTAHRFGVDAVRTSDPGAARLRARLRALAPDLYVISSFPRLLSPAVLGLAARGGLNLHPGRLPAERGPAPLFWALKAGRTELIWSIHILEVGEDSGDVVAEGSYVFTPGARAQDILRGVAERASPSLVRAARDLYAGQILRRPQGRVGVGRAPRPTLADRRIDPRRQAVEVFTFAAGCAGIHRLYVECGGDRFYVEDAVDYDMEGRLPSEFVLTGDRLLLQCAPGVVELELAPGGTIFTSTYREPGEP
jgi:methionyl-tRNA formyltransferase